MIEAVEAGGTSRRTVMGMAGSALLAAALPLPARATMPGPRAIRLDLPPAWENGNSVPLTVTVDSPMTEQDHVRTIRIVAERNPLPDVVTFRFTPLSGMAQASTRIRLAASQTIRAVAELSDGTILTDQAWVEVTLGGCGD